MNASIDLSSFGVGPVDLAVSKPLGEDGVGLSVSFEGGTFVGVVELLVHLINPALDGHGQWLAGAGLFGRRVERALGAGGPVRALGKGVVAAVAVAQVVGSPGGCGDAQASRQFLRPMG